MISKTGNRCSLRTAAALSAVALLVGCSGFGKEADPSGKQVSAAESALAAQPLIKPLKPARKPRFSVGDSFVFKFGNGVQQTENVVAVHGDRVGWALANGAKWTTSSTAMFNTSRWSGTKNFGKGHQRFVGWSRSLFPLRVGRSVRYRAVGRSTQDPKKWTLKWTCTVPSQERVTVVAGSFDTFRVICHRPGQTRTYYYAPKVGLYVLRLTMGTNPGSKELVSYRKVRS